MHRSITRIHRGITRMHSDAARRRIINPIHAAPEKGLGDNVDDDDDDIDDRESLAEVPVDRAFALLVDYIYEWFPHSEPQTAASAALRCDYESYFAIADPPEPSSKFMRLYPRVSEIQTSVSDYAANLAREILLSRRRSLSIGDAPDFCKQRFINSDFAHLSVEVST